MADTTASVSTAKSQWSRLLARVEGGEQIVSTRAGRPVAELAPLTRRRPRTPGMERREVVIHHDLDDPLAEFEEYR